MIPNSMRRFSTLALALLAQLSLAQAPDVSSIEASLAPLAAKYPGVSFTLAKSEFKGTWANINYKPVQDLASAKTYVAMFVEEFAKYPADFIKLAKLKRVELVEKLAVGTQFRSAVPDYFNEVLYYDVAYVTNMRYARHVVHHEFYHMLEQEWNGDSYYKDPNWAHLNEKDFKYGAGGSSAYGRGDVWSFVHPHTGFVNLYSTYGIEEDKAEIWAVLFVPENWSLVKGFLDGDAVLRAKVSYMREFGRSKSPAMDQKFWTAVSGG